MSSLIVEVCKVDKVQKHPRADRLAIATVKGWKTCIRIDPDTKEPEFKEGDLCIFIPPDAILPPELANDPDDSETPGRLGVIKYLGALPKNVDGVRPAGGRVKATRLRSEPSYGLIVHIDPSKGDDLNWNVGADVTEYFGITKWEPPVESHEGDAAPEHPRFHSYTDIEHYGNHHEVLVEGEQVVLTEKIHGKNSRVGLVIDSDDKGNAVSRWMAGSHAVNRKEFNVKTKYSKHLLMRWLQKNTFTRYVFHAETTTHKSEYWEVLTDDLRALIKALYDQEEAFESVIVFGEIYGSGVQDMAYGLINGKRGFRVFDIAVNRTYLSHEMKATLCKAFKIEMVPVVAIAPYSRALVDKHCDGKTLSIAMERL